MSSSARETVAAPSSIVFTREALDSLRSPDQSEFDSKILERDSRITSIVGSELDDISLDDEPPRSEIEMLTPKPMTSSVDDDSPLPGLVNEGDKEDSKANGRISNKDEHLPLELDFNPSGKKHTKSASVTTIRSGYSVSVPTDSPRNSARMSVDGQQKLQEEFSRLQKEKQALQDQGGEGAIDWDFWGAVISDYQGFAAERPEELAQAIAKGIPAALRGMMWQHMAASKDLELEGAYIKLLKEISPHEKAITRDLGRTFPTHAFFTDGQGIGQENLFNVLKAYSLYDHQVGYCQGLPFIVAILLLNMPDEEAFSLLVRLMQVYDLRGHYLPEMPKLQLRIFQFDRLIEELLPVLHVHFLRQGIKSTMFCSQWFLTMFSYRFPLEIVYRIYDHCLANGIEAIFGFSIMLLKKNEDILLTLKFDEILAHLNHKILDRYKVVQEDGTPVEPAKYRVDEHDYEEMIREASKTQVQLDDLRNSNRALSQQCKSLEASLSQLNTEHVEVLNELVKQRLRNEELEGELVRYKLLYAEAMHQNEDARLSQRLSLTQMHMRNASKS